MPRAWRDAGSRLRPSPVFRRGAALLAGSLGAQALGFAAAPVLARLYGLHAFGIYGAFTGAASLVAAIASLGIENAILMERSEQDRAASYGVALLVALCTAVLASVAASVLGTGFGSAFGASVLALAALRAATNRALGLDRAHAASCGRFVRGVGVALAQILLGLASPSGQSLVLGSVLGQAAAALATMALLGAAGRPRPGPAQGWGAIFRRHAALLRWSAPQTLLNALGNGAVPILLLRVFGADAAGAYALANRVVQTLATTLGEAMRGALLAELGPRAARPEALRALTRAWSVRLGIALAVAAAVFASVATPLFALVFGARWSEAGPLASLLLAAECAGIANIPAITAITVRGALRPLFLFQAVTLPPRLAALAACASPIVAIGVWSGSGIAASIAVTLATIASLGHQSRDAAPEGHAA